MSYNYYIVNGNGVSTTNDELLDGEHIFKIRKTNLILKFEEEYIEGPFLSVKELKKSSIIFKNLIISNPKRAERIQKAYNIQTFKGGLLTKPGVTYSKDFFDSVGHTTHGKVKKSNVFGVHYFDSSRVKIIKGHRLDVVTGVWSAEVEVLNVNNQKWVKKEGITTFFPRSWHPSKILYETHMALNSKVRVKNTNHKYESTTPSGVKVEIIILDNQIKTIYPIF